MVFELDWLQIYQGKKFQEFYRIGSYDIFFEDILKTCFLSIQVNLSMNKNVTTDHFR